MSSNPPSPPGVSVFLTVRNEAEHLEQVVERIFAQEYPGPFEVVMSVGPSADQTAAQAARLAERFEQLRVIENPTGSIPKGLNLAWRATKHEYLVRVDGHAMLPPGYIRRAMELLEETGAANVGCLVIPEGTTPFQKAVARAISSPWGIGPQPFRTGGEAGPAQTAFLGIFHRADLEQIGGYSESFGRAEDWELNHRLIQAGKLVWFDPSLAVVYRPRRSWRPLFRQFFSTGRWRWQLVRAYPDTASPRYLAPPVVTLAVAGGLVVGVLAALAGKRRLAALALSAPAIYAAGVTAAAAHEGHGLDRSARRWLAPVMATMHLAWGAGFLRGIGDRPVVPGEKT
ncbi:MAG: glycosyltransferase family 2 protein [Bifidobacteriaceae bacterium]|nr:glycosyltransferase family 2 protein [Bifidobacteriaceae bacterium]